MELVKEKYVNGWDDPRMPTLSGIRRRGYTPEAIRNFCSEIGMAKADSTIDIAFLEYFVREDLNKRAPRVMGVLNPLKVVIENYPDNKTEELDAVNNPEDLSDGKRKIPFSRIIYIEKEDFMEDPPKKFFRLAPGREVRLRYAYFIKCNDIVKDKKGNIVEIHCTYDPETKGGDAPDGRKVKATLHWVSEEHSIGAEIRLYDRLFLKEDPLKTAEERDYKENINPDSLKILEDCRVEPSLAKASPGDIYQFERMGYFSVDPETSIGKIIFNRTATLRDQWARINKKN